MKKIFLSCCLLFICVTVFSQSPKFINYQGVARLANSTSPVLNQSVRLNFRIFQDKPGGTVIFSEPHLAVTDDCGLFNVKIGEMDSAGFAAIDWSKGRKFLEVNINSSVTGTTELLSVPFSLYADKAHLAERAAFADSTNNTSGWLKSSVGNIYAADGQVGIGTATPQSKLDVSGDIKATGIEASGVVKATGLNITGNGNFNCITIKGGCDIYEEFRCSDVVEPGEVISLDVNGKLNTVTKCSKAYDRNVVGVVSGGYGVNPGIGLTQAGLLEGNVKVAMMGKVYVKVIGEVRAGDLMTSSSKPGYAMAARNKRRAHGAILGKALAKQNNDGWVLMQIMML